MGRPKEGETLRHKEAFEYYYTLGPDRNLKKVAERFGVSLRSVGNWSKKYNWMERVKQRDIELAQEMRERNNEAILSEKAKIRTILKALYNQLVKDLRDGKVKIKSVSDLEKVVKLDLMLMGEPTEVVDNRVGLTVEDREAIDKMREAIWVDVTGGRTEDEILEEESGEEEPDEGETD